MAGNELFFDPLQDGQDGQDESAVTPAPVASRPRAAVEPAQQRSLELLRVRDELEKMARSGKGS